jgi:predicted RNA-binding Zn-ribbon protein involved in translation (DUF1610 family)
VDRNNDEEKCRTCGTVLVDEGGKEKACVNPECPTNKRTKPICQECRVIMEELAGDAADLAYKCPVCGVVSRP